MHDIKSIEEAVQALTPTALAEFRRWFADFDASAWDRQIEADVAAGRLDALLAEARADHEGTPPRPL